MYFSCHSDQAPDKKQLKGKRKDLFWLMIGWARSIMPGQVAPWYWQHGPGTSRAMPQNIMDHSSGFSSPRVQSGALAHGMAPTIRVAFLI